MAVLRDPGAPVAPARAQISQPPAFNRQAAICICSLRIVDRSAPRVEEMEPGVSSWCCECEDTPAALFCKECDEPFCRPCCGAQHRRGKRRAHVFSEISEGLLPQPLAPARPAGGGNAVRDSGEHSALPPLFCACHHGALMVLDLAGCRMAPS